MKKWIVCLSIVLLFYFVGCMSFGDIFLTNQQKQWKAEGRNVKTGLFDEPYSGKSFQEKSELDAFMETEEYLIALSNYNAWKSAYDREQNRVDNENRRIRSSNQAAKDDMERRAHNWIYSVKKDGLERRIFNPSSLFEERYTHPGSQMTATLLVDNVVVASNTFYCQIQAELKNQVGEYNPNKKY